MNEPLIPPALVLGCNTPHGIGVLSDWIEEQTGHAPDFADVGWFHGTGAGSKAFYTNTTHGNGYGDGFDYTGGGGDGSGDGHRNAYDNGYGNGFGNGNRAGFRYDDGDGSGDGFKYGYGNGNGNGVGNGRGHGSFD